MQAIAYRSCLSSSLESMPIWKVARNLFVWYGAKKKPSWKNDMRDNHPPVYPVDRDGQWDESSVQTERDKPRACQSV